MFRKEKLQLKKRKNAALKVLLLSAFVTFMCLSMLVGTTYAWLTDSVTSAKNTIVSGQLDVKLNYYKDGAWAAADVDVFEDVLWEPGKFYSRAVELKNNSDMPIKFAFKANVPSEFGSINTEGEAFLVTAYMKLLQEPFDTAEAVIEAITGADSRADANAVALNESAPLNGRIEANSSKYVLITIKMPQQGVEKTTKKDGMPAPKFDVQLVLTAIQATTQDSFGETEVSANPPSPSIDPVKYQLDTAKLLYKKDGAYIIENADDFARFVSAVKNGETFTGETVKLLNEGDIDLGGADWPLTGAFAGTFNGNGKTIKNFKVVVTAAGAIKLLGNNASGVILNGVTVSEGYHLDSIAADATVTVSATTQP